VIVGKGINRGKAGKRLGEIWENWGEIGEKNGCGQRHMDIDDIVLIYRCEFKKMVGHLTLGAWTKALII
jgi:hypothetical protein